VASAARPLQLQRAEASQERGSKVVTLARLSNHINAARRLTQGARGVTLDSHSAPGVLCAHSPTVR
jgi:hypothetical protein